VVQLCLESRQRDLTRRCLLRNIAPAVVLLCCPKGCSRTPLCRTNPFPLARSIPENPIRTLNGSGAGLKTHAKSANGSAPRLKGIVRSEKGYEKVPKCAEPSMKRLEWRRTVPETGWWSPCARPSRV